MAFGEVVETRYDLSKADVIVSLDADFLYAGFPGSTRYMRDFAATRNPDGNMNRLYVVESTPSSTGMKADHRIPVRGVGWWERFAAVTGSQNRQRVAARMCPEAVNAIVFLTCKLTEGSSVVIAGDHQPPACSRSCPRI